MRARACLAVRLRHGRLASSLLLLLAVATGAAAQPDLAPIQALIDHGDAEGALAALAAIPKPEKDPGALLLRSSARFMLGERANGLADLERALELDPRLRQGWLNLAGFHLSEGRLDEALSALERARDLDPAALDNDLNIGAVKILQGDAAAAAELFERYLAANDGDAEAEYLVATNYMVAGERALAIRHLERAVAREERTRLLARTDPNFAALAADPAFERLLATDLHRPPTGAHLRAAVLPAPYAGGTGPLLAAVLDALQLGGEALDPRVEVTPGWALIWAAARIKVLDDPEGGRLELSAPAAAFTPGEWAAWSDRLLAAIEGRLAASSPPVGGPAGRVDGSRQRR